MDKCAQHNNERATLLANAMYWKRASFWANSVYSNPSSPVDVVCGMYPDSCAALEKAKRVNARESFM